MFTVSDAIVEHCEKLEGFLERGIPRDDLRPGLRTMSFRRSVTIAYAAGEDEVAIVGIFSGGQNFEGVPGG